MNGPVDAKELKIAQIGLQVLKGPVISVSIHEHDPLQNAKRYRHVFVASYYLIKIKLNKLHVFF